jgi:hypothetical protein
LFELIHYPEKTINTKAEVKFSNSLGACSRNEQNRKDVENRNEFRPKQQTHRLYIDYELLATRLLIPVPLLLSTL